MFSYLHRYHAGNFADIHKHLILIAILLYLRKKDKPFCVLDTHAGEGIYDLNSPESQKIKEYRLGIFKILDDQSEFSLIQELLRIIYLYKKENNIIYPGSPAIIQHFLRNNDRAIFCEKHPTTFKVLKNYFFNKKNIILHYRDSFEAMNGLTPFKEKRGLIFVDPSYEIKKDFVTVLEQILLIFPKFNNGIFTIWYPILKTNEHLALTQKINSIPFAPYWHSQWFPYPFEEGMLGSGIIVINPPWNIEKIVLETFNYLNEKYYINGTFKTTLFTPQ